MKYIHLALILRCQCPSVCPFLCDGVHWRIIGNLSFKFRSPFTAHCGRGECVSEPGRVEGSSRAMLATARPSCYDQDVGEQNLLMTRGRRSRML